MSRFISAGIGVMAFFWGLAEAFSGVEYWEGIAYPERVAWWYWVPAMLAGGFAALAVLTLRLWPLESALVVAFSMFVIATSEIVDVFMFNGGRRSAMLSGFSVLLGGSVYWCFSRTPRVSTSKV